MTAPEGGRREPAGPRGPTQEPSDGPAPVANGDPRTLVRPYTVTRGRTVTASAWPPETVVSAVDRPESAGESATGPVTDAGLRGLARRARGPVWLPGDPGFDEELAAAASPVEHRPRVILGARDADDVTAAVTFAAEHRLPVTVQATGYGTHAPVEDGILVATRRMRELAVDTRRRVVRVGAGVVWSEVITAAARHGLAPPCGSAVGVGVVGHALGGGVGPLARSIGFAADAVLAVELVTADGVRRRVDAEHHPDLFWALRGGAGAGGVTVGVVTALELRLAALTRLWGGGLWFDGSAAPVVVGDWVRWTTTLSEATTTSLALSRAIDPARRSGGRAARPPVVHLRVAHTGSNADGATLAVAMREHGPIVDTLAELPVTAVDTIHDSAGHEAWDTAPGTVWTRGLLLPELPPEAIRILLDAAGPDAVDPPVGVEIRHLGGATAHPEDPGGPGSALGGRGARYGVVLVDVLGRDGAPPPRGPRLLERLAPFALGRGGGEAGNDRDVDRGTVTTVATAGATELATGAASDATTRSRLADLATRLDPDGLFRGSAGRRSRPSDRVSGARADPALPEARAIVALARPWRSVAEIASELGLPLGVVRVLLADLDEAGLVTVHRSPLHDSGRSGASSSGGSGAAADAGGAAGAGDPDDDTNHLERVLRGLRNRL